VRPVRGKGLLVTVSVALASLLWSVGAAAHTSACSRRYCRTPLAANSAVRVYRQFKNAPFGGEVDSAIYAVWHRLRPLAVDVELEEGAVYNEAELPAIAGDYVAVAVSTGEGYNGEGRSWFIRRVDVRTRISEETHPSTLGGTSQGVCHGGLPEGSPGVTDLVVTARGTVAWVIGGEDPTPGTGAGSYRVCVMGRSSTTPRLLAAAGSIAPHSLATAGGSLYWTEGTTARRVSVP
jgi:hypothetical protein